MISFVERALLYAHTIRHLRFRQIIYLPIRRLRLGTGTLLRSRRQFDHSQYARLRASIPILLSEAKISVDTAESTVKSEFTFLNRSLEIPRIDWNAQYVNKLWTYNLHYFNYVRDLVGAYRQSGDSGYLSAFESLVGGWIDGAKDRSSAGWEPFPLSVRLVNWSYALIALDDVLAADFRQRLLDSLYDQLRYLATHLEWHLLGNHLAKNLSAVVIGSSLFAGPDAERLRLRAARLLWREVLEQVNPDGGHFERSPMYHGIVLQDLLETVAYARAAGIPIPIEVVHRLEAMIATADVLFRRNDGPHALNDSANGQSLSISELGLLATRIIAAGPTARTGFWELAITGFCGLRDASTNDEIVVDCAPPAPTYQPGHAHCGILSYELDVGGVPAIVDSGVHGYDNDRFREYVRSTRAHNTVTVAGKDQSEMWGTFRVARRAEMISSQCSMESDAFVFRGAYRPYHNRRIEHHRMIRRTKDTVLIEDLIRNGFDKPLESFIHFHPAFSVRLEKGLLSATNGRVTFDVEAFGVDSIGLHRAETDPIQGWYCPEFGTAMPQHVAVLRVHRNAEKPFGYRILVRRRSL